MVVEKQSGKGSGGVFFLVVFPLIGLLLCGGFLWAALNAKQVFPGEKNFRELHSQVQMLQKKMEEAGSTPVQIRAGDRLVPAEEVMKGLRHREKIILNSLPVVERQLPVAALAGMVFFLVLSAAGLRALSLLRKAEAGIAAARKYFGLSLPAQESPRLENLVGRSRLLTAFSSLAMAAFWVCVALVAFHYYVQSGGESIGKYLCAVAAMAAFLSLFGFLRTLVSPDLSALKEKEEEEEQGYHDGRILRRGEARGLEAFVEEWAGKAGLRMPDSIAVGDDGLLFAPLKPLNLTGEENPATGVNLYVSRPLLAFLSRPEAGALIVWSLARLQPGENRKGREFDVLDEEAANCEHYLRKRFSALTLNNGPALALVRAYRRALRPLLGGVDSENERGALRRAEAAAGRGNLSVALTRQAILRHIIENAVFEAMDTDSAGGPDNAIPARVKKGLAEFEPVLRGMDPSELADLPEFSLGGEGRPSLVALLQLQGSGLDAGLMDKALAPGLFGLPRELGLAGAEPEEQSALPVVGQPAVTVTGNMSLRDLREPPKAGAPQVKPRKRGSGDSHRSLIAVTVIGGLASYLYQVGNVGLAFMLGLFAFAGLLLTIRRMHRDRQSRKGAFEARKSPEDSGD